MKKFIVILIVFALAFVSCDNGTTGNGNGGSTTTLQIKNLTSTFICEVKWNNKSFTKTSDIIFESGFHEIEHLGPGDSSDETVSPGSGYIYFALGTYQYNRVYNKRYRTAALEKVSEGKTAEFVFLDSTLILDLANPNKIDKLSSFLTP